MAKPRIARRQLRLPVALPLKMLPTFLRKIVTAFPAGLVSDRKKTAGGRCGPSVCGRSKQRWARLRVHGCGSVHGIIDGEHASPVPPAPPGRTADGQQKPADAPRHRAARRRVRSRPLAGRLNLPAWMISDGSDPALQGGKVLHLVLHQVLHPPTRRAAPAAKKEGSLPSFPSPLARLGSAGLSRKNPRATAEMGSVVCCTPPLFLLHPPLCRCNISRGPQRDPRRDPGTGTARRSGRERGASRARLWPDEPARRPGHKVVNRAATVLCPGRQFSGRRITRVSV